MARAKIHRKSTNIDMTAMCDVAFLLLSFFILTTKFKPAEAITVTPPNSVSTKAAPNKDIVLITMEKSGKVFLSMDNEEMKGKLAEKMNEKQNLGLDVNAFKKAGFYGCSFANLKQFLTIPEEQRKGNNLPGIPCNDSISNELTGWMTLIKEVYSGKEIHLLLKGDNDAKYSVFDNVKTAFVKNDFDRFQMVTNPESVPSGTELWKASQLKASQLNIKK